MLVSGMMEREEGRGDSVSVWDDGERGGKRGQC